MARVLVFDSWANAASDGSPINASLWAGTFHTNPTYAVRSQPLRIFHHDEDINLVSWEFLATNFQDVTAIVPVYFFQEFYGDEPSLDAPPNRRDWMDVPIDAPWGHETVANYDSTLTTVNMEVLDRRLLMRCRPPFLADSIWMPLAVHALWVRLAIWLCASDPERFHFTAAGQFRLRVFAHVGGHSETAYLREHGTEPYAYNAFK